jgi:hypothetical protein
MTNFLRGVCVTTMVGVVCPAVSAAQQAVAQTTPAAPSETLQPARGGQRGRLTPSERANMPAPQGFSVVLVLGEMQAAGSADTVPPAARKALADMKDFLPYKTYRLLDAQWSLCCGRSAIVTRLRGDEQDYYDLELEPNRTDTSGKWYVRFALRNALAGTAQSDGETNVRMMSLEQQRAALESQLRDLKQRYNDNHPEVQKARTRLAEIEREQSQVRMETARRRAAMPSPVNRRTIIDTSFTMDIGETVVVGTSRLQGDKALIALLTAVASTKPTTR